ncbi:MBL fold metallo-hydrolase [Desulfotignum phosphitoxidans]|uniref:Metallo-beta-lactamase domain-containing protein n=1 Tax=Desulfotignum phosphitoxidans DSM 13687 TaxID=1286635 RepID=S0FWK7_9BACT|nr:hypothetical protein [Desulfotignum phosphitoxidans]EMS79453.1 hypothetical protein Dpo_5c03800 [Desulfotignum phosphitoxidans DSM 13687]
MIPIIITHLGAQTCVTGARHLIQVQPDHCIGINILVACGIAWCLDPQVPFNRFPVPPADIDFLFLTHAHIHISRVPDLMIDARFSGKIIFTHLQPQYRASETRPGRIEKRNFL